MRKVTLERIAFWAVLFGIGLAATSPALAESKFSFASTPGQLPKDVIPHTAYLSTTNAFLVVGFSLQTGDSRD